MSRERHRSRVSIIVAVLAAIEREGGEQTVNRILSEANLPYNRLTTFLDELERLEFVSKREVEGRKIYSLTDKGRKYMKEYERFRNLSEAFGLRI
ncbi:MAG: winged helix-turn-helix domain-containing protein [Thermoprotei archaeon]